MAVASDERNVEAMWRRLALFVYFAAAGCGPSFAFSVEDQLMIGDCPTPISIRRPGPLAEFDDADRTTFKQMDAHFRKFGGDLDKLLMNQDRSMWLAYHNVPNVAKISSEQWTYVKQRVSRADKLAPDVKWLSVSSIRDEGSRLLIVSKVAGKAPDGTTMPEVAMGELWARSSGCLVKVTLHSSDSSDVPAVEQLLGSILLGE